MSPGSYEVPSSPDGMHGNGANPMRCRRGNKVSSCPNAMSARGYEVPRYADHLPPASNILFRRIGGHTMRCRRGNQVSRSPDAMPGE